MSYSLVKNKKGSALLISLIVLVLLSLASTVFVEKVWNFSKASTGIKDSNRAYYFSLWTIEEALMNPKVTKYSPWTVAQTGITLPAPDNIIKTLTVYTGGTSVPTVDKWNSPFDKSYNIISMGSPVQLVIPDGVSWNNVAFTFRVPNIPGGGSNTWMSSSTLMGSWFILWSLGYTGWTLLPIEKQIRLQKMKWMEQMELAQKMALQTVDLLEVSMISTQILNFDQTEQNV